MGGTRGLAAVAAAVFLAWLSIGPATAGAATPTADNCPEPIVPINTSYGSDIAQGSLGVAEVACRSIAALETDEDLRVRVRRSGGNSSYANWWLYDSQGSQFCSARGYSYAGFKSCAPTGEAPYTLVIAPDENDTLDYEAQALGTSGAGCQDIGAATWTDGTPMLSGEIVEYLDVDCFKFTRASDAADQKLWVRFNPSVSYSDFEARLFSPEGGNSCIMDRYNQSQNCDFTESGDYFFEISQDDTDTGSYRLSLADVVNTDRCTEISSVEGSASGELGSAEGFDCLNVTGASAGDRLDVRMATAGGVGSTSYRPWRLFNKSGAQLCDGTSASVECTLSTAGPYKLMIFDEYLAGTGFDWEIGIRNLAKLTDCTALDEAQHSLAAEPIEVDLTGSFDAACFTFERGLEDGDGTYWFRAMRRAGELQARGRVLRANGSKICTFNSISAWGCDISAVGEITVLVDADSGSGAGRFALNAWDMKDPEGCGEVPSVAFGSSAFYAQTGTGGASCYAIPGVSRGDAVSITYRQAFGNDRWAIVDGDGYTPCSGSYSYSYGTERCSLGGGADYFLIAWNDSSTAGGGTQSRIGVQRLTDPAGCTPLTEEDLDSIGGPLTGEITDAQEPVCFRFDRAADDPDQWLGAGVRRATGSLNPQAWVYGANGAEQCEITVWINMCQLSQPGRNTIVVRANYTDIGGTFALWARRADLTSGCETIPAVTTAELVEVEGVLEEQGEIDCYLLDAVSQDQIVVTPSGAADSLEVMNPHGTIVCRERQECTFNGDRQRTVFVYDSNGAIEGDYSISLSCSNPPCGQSRMSIAGVEPSRIGAGANATVLVRGRSLDSMESVSIVSGGTTIDGEILAVSPSGRSAQVRFAVTAGVTGQFNLTGTFEGGSTRTLNGALNVEASRPVDLSIALNGRSTYRAGTDATFTVGVSNSGNIDAEGVPVMVSGIPTGTTVKTKFKLRRPTGTIGAVDLDELELSTGDFVTADGTIGLPLLLPTVPARGSVEYEFEIRPPSDAEPFEVEAHASACLSAPSGIAGDVAGVILTCAENIAQVVLGLTGEGDCLTEAITRAPVVAAGLTGHLTEVGTGEAVGLMKAWQFALDSANCGLSQADSDAITKRVLVMLGLATDVDGATELPEELIEVVAECVDNILAVLGLSPVIAIDPNEMVGPAGSGEERYIAGDSPLSYRILFENMPDSTASAARVELVDVLDSATLDPGSVLFSELRFGSTVFALPFPDNRIETVIDLRPEQDLLVDVGVEVDDDGVLRAVLQALDPATGEPPEDATTGFLPPNLESPEGEGHLDFTVMPRSVESGTVISNGAEITFDANDPIETNVWTNVVDKSPPSAELEIVDAPGDRAVELAWSGSDDAAGVGSWELRVSRDGAPFTIWKVVDDPGSATYRAKGDGTYRFRAIARDRAGNVGLSNQTSIALAATDGGGSGSGGGGSGSGSGSGGGSAGSADCSQLQQKLAKAEKVLKKVIKKTRKAKRKGKTSKAKKLVKKRKNYKRKVANRRGLVDSFCGS